MSRLGRYRMLGILGLAVMTVGMILLSRLDADSTRRDVTMGMIVLGVGLGVSMPLFMLAVQNAVPYRLMGASTSTLQFLRSVGATMGVAVMFSIIQAQYHQELTDTVPAEVQPHPQLAEALGDPQFLLNGQALAQMQQAFEQFGDQGPALFDQTMTAVRGSLASGITNGFFIAIFVLAAAVVVAFFMKEIPIRRTHALSEEGGPEPENVAPGQREASMPGALPVLTPIRGASNGEPP